MFHSSWRYAKIAILFLSMSDERPIISQYSGGEYPLARANVSSYSIKDISVEENTRLLKVDSLT